MLFLLGAVLSIPLVVGGLERSARSLASLLYGNEGALGSANIHRSVSRTMLTVACLMIALVMIIGIGTLSHSFKEDLSAWVNNALGGDLFIRTTDPLRESFVSLLEDVPGVEAVSPMRYHPVRIAESSLTSEEGQVDQVVFTAIMPAKFRQIGDMEFSPSQGDPDANWSALSAGNALFVSSVVAEELGLQQGDSLNLHTRRGEHAFSIAAVTTDFTGQGYVVTGTYTDLKRWFAESGVDRFSIHISPGYEVQSVAQDIEDRYQERYNIEVLTTETLRSSVIDLTDQAFLLFDVLSMIGLVIGALGVINTLTMNVLERTREIGTLRSLGMVRAQVLRMVLAEAMALGTMGSIYGVLFGFAISKVFVDTMVALTSYEVNYLFSLRPYLLGVLVTFGVSQVAASGPARRAARVNIVEALLHE